MWRAFSKFDLIWMALRKFKFRIALFRNFPKTCPSSRSSEMTSSERSSSECVLSKSAQTVGRIKWSSKNSWSTRVKLPKQLLEQFLKSCWKCLRHSQVLRRNVQATVWATSLLSTNCFWNFILFDQLFGHFLRTHILNLIFPRRSFLNFGCSGKFLATSWKAQFWTWTS